MDENGNFFSKVVDKNGKEIDPSLLKSKDKSLFSGKLKDILKIKAGELGFVSDDEILEVIVALKHENIVLDEKPSTMEVHIGISGEEEEIKLNGQIIDKKTLKEKDKKRAEKLKKARKIREDKMRKKIESFAKINKLEKDNSVLKAYKNARSSIILKLKKGELEKFALKNKDLIVSMELFIEPTNDLISAMLSTNIDPEVLNNNAIQGNDIGIYMSEVGCPNTTPVHITNYTRLAGSTDDHSENVSAIIRGVSPNSYIYCRDGGILPTADDLDGTGGNPSIYVENHSYATDYTTDYTTRDKELDNHIYDDNIAVFKSAGNLRQDPDDFSFILDDINVTSPGKALNAITVGNYDDSNDVIHISSRYNNPETGNQKPELSAPGTNITAGGHTKTGTSMASPHAAGFAADLMSAYSWLELRPYYLKALMLSGATNSISGGVGKVGVGGIDFYRTYYNTINNYWEGTNNSYSTIDSTDDVPNNGYIDWNVNLTAGKEVRVAISWLNSGTYTYDHRGDAHPIGMDLDLTVYNPNGGTVGSSNSWDNPYEVVDFTTSTTGTYRVRIFRSINRDTTSDLRIGASVNWQ